MALFRATLRGSVAGEKWALTMWYQSGDSVTFPSPAGAAENLAQAVRDEWVAKLRPVTTNQATLEKVVVEGAYEPEQFFDLAVNVSGQVGGQLAPTWVAVGFRQLRSVQNFRASTHRYLAPIEENTSGNVWVPSGAVDAPMMATAATFFSDTLDQDPLAPIFVPVLIRTQYTTKNPDGSKTTTYLNPWETSPVAGATFYGLTSQVSRKTISGAS